MSYSTQERARASRQLQPAGPQQHGGERDQAAVDPGARMCPADDYRSLVSSSLCDTGSAASHLTAPARLTRLFPKVCVGAAVQGSDLPAAGFRFAPVVGRRRGSGYACSSRSVQPLGVDRVPSVGWATYALAAWRHRCSYDVRKASPQREPYRRPGLSTAARVESPIAHLPLRFVRSVSSVTIHYVLYGTVVVCSSVHSLTCVAALSRLHRRQAFKCRRR